MAKLRVSCKEKCHIIINVMFTSHAPPSLFTPPTPTPSSPPSLERHQSDSGDREIMMSRVLTITSCHGTHNTQQTADHGTPITQSLHVVVVSIVPHYHTVLVPFFLFYALTCNLYSFSSFIYCGLVREVIVYSTDYLISLS